jgi:PIN domain nuclease of toxin-antitoxin system
MGFPPRQREEEYWNRSTSSSPKSDNSVIDFGAELGRRTADLRTSTRPLGLSFGDRACLALAGQLHLPALTADRAWRNLTIDVEIRLIR